MGLEQGQAPGSSLVMGGVGGLGSWMPGSSLVMEGVGGLAG